MGRPFEQEIEKTIDTFAWASEQPVEELTKQLLRSPHLPLFIVGSGGSLSACHLAAFLYQKMGVIAKAITPLDLFYCKEAIRGAKVLFISASGKNSDIIFAFKTAIACEPYSLTGVCMKKDTPLGKLSKDYSGIAKVFEYKLPSGKDGFLATNSLIAYFGILLKVFGCLNESRIENVSQAYLSDLSKFVKRIDKSYSHMVLYGGWGQPVAADLESKFVESALGDISISDYRNFAHGRHHWFAKRGKSSSIIAVITPSEEKLAAKTIALLPKSIPVLTIKCENESPFGILDLLIKSFHLVKDVGKMQGIDPGRPGVPEYGRKLYNLKYASTLREDKDSVDNIIVRKVNCKTLRELTSTEYEYWKNAYQVAKDSLAKASFGAIVFDYDGTLCSFDNRFLGISDKAKEELIRILDNGFIVGIATGRGQSIRVDLQKAIPEKYWKNFIIGYYNGSDIGLLSDDAKPDKKKESNKHLLELHNFFNQNEYPLKFKSELRPNQLTIELEDTKNWNRIKPFILQTVKVFGYPEIELLESTHSIDIVSRPHASKLNLLPFCKDLLKSKSLPIDILCIGDKGQWPGNDFELLSTLHALSVDEVSPTVNSAWNFSKPGVKNIDALLDYLKSVEVKNGALKLKIT
jgi:hypothetical protein